MKKLFQLIPLLLLVGLAMAQTQHGRITQQSGVGVSTLDGLIVLTTSSLTGEVTFGAGGVAADGDGLKHGRITTGSIASSTSSAVALTWATAFADANYTASCDVVEGDADTATLQIDHIRVVDATALTVIVENEDAVSAKTGTLHCIALHD
jgi:hypothetical protein